MTNELKDKQRYRYYIRQSHIRYTPKQASGSIFGFVITLIFILLIIVGGMNGGK